MEEKKIVGNSHIILMLSFTSLIGNLVIQNSEIRLKSMHFTAFYRTTEHYVLRRFKLLVNCSDMFVCNILDSTVIVVCRVYYTSFVIASFASLLLLLSLPPAVVLRWKFLDRESGSCLL